MLLHFSVLDLHAYSTFPSPRLWNIQSVSRKLEESKRIFASLLADKSLPIPEEIKRFAAQVEFYNDQTDKMILPCPLKECEVSTALKGVEASVALAIAQLRFQFPEGENHVKIDMQHALLFLFMTYIASVDGMTKFDKNVVSKLKATDLNRAQSDLYRRMSANLYKTKDDKFYHIHGSLEATTTLNMIGLPAFMPELNSDYEKIVDVIQGAVAKYTAAELEAMNNERRQAGVEALKPEQFLESPHGKALSAKPSWEIKTLETSTPPAPFSPVSLASGEKPQILKGIKVLELCRIIAGPTVGRILAEYGAEVIKVSASDILPDVPFFQVDGNVGKHTTDLNLKDPNDRTIFEGLLADADIVLDGFRTGAIDRLGYGAEHLAGLGQKRGKGYIYGAENCFGFEGEWSHRPGWQQIADCVTGVAWIQGQALGLQEPMIPPFPKADYGTGCMVAIAVLTAVYERATKGGSYLCTSSLSQYDLFLLKQKQYPAEIWEEILAKQDPTVRKLRYFDSVDMISRTVLQSMKNVDPNLFSNEKYLDSEYSEGFQGQCKVLKGVVEMKLCRNGFNCPTRPNGYDKPEWWM
ncbi:hypothetical protein BABINDRAFT_9731 [Babjeviella inositovora NRRL Y-12698]|uniref:CoA-transferase family III n=1 Tax=Babjeviella inositovora NRRL Y-12698 TaxID=984486 RepID=A0A1E3QM24_9ASCO|nr:uncharacterized protein BABINDRAFT_9731 [Babjeviella inositovora NRRL Y-12698]ODQ78132.1 hypothetical protein BABINDRAFT_9731 [Babjeviella inositovora NRRL Y-12698]